MEGYRASLKSVTLGTKIAAGSMKALGMAVNVVTSMALTMGISLAIQGVVTWISKLITAEQDAIDKADELTDAYKSSTDEINSNISSLQSLEEKFKLLSKGVDDYGNNISLSTDEYKQYKDIVEQIIGISPSLATGYDNEGNAIANKNGLIERSIELMKEEQRLRLDEMTSDDTIKKMAKGKIVSYDKAERKTNGGIDKNALASKLVEIGENNQFSKSYDIAQILGVEKDWLENIGGYSSPLQSLVLKNMDEVIVAIRDKREELLSVMSIDQLNEVEKIIDSYNRNMSIYDRQLEQQSKSLNPTLQLVPQTLTAYDAMSDAQKTFISDYINGFRITADTTERDVMDMKSNILDFTQSIADNPTAQNAISQLFSLDKTKSYEEWKNNANSLLNIIAGSLGLTGDKRKDFIIKFGFDTTATETAIKELDDKMPKVTAKQIKSLNEEDIKIAYELDNVGDLTFDELKAKIESWKNENQIPSVLDPTEESFKKAREATDKLITSTKTLSSAFTEQIENGKLSAESILAITDAGYASALQVDEETGAVTLNADAYRRLVEAKISEHLTTLAINRNTIKQQLDSEKEAVDQLTAAYNSSRDAMLLAEIAKHKGTKDKLQGQYDNADAEYESVLGLLDSGIYGATEDEIAKKKKDAAEKQAESQKKLDELATQNRLDLLKHELEEKKALIEKYNSDIEMLDLESELSNGLSNEKTMENLSTKFDTMVKKGETLKAEFEYLADLEPTSAAEAQAIADRITQVGADIRANLLDLNKVRQEIDMFRVDVINQQITNRSEMATREFELLDQNIQLIQNRMAGKSGLFGNNLMPFDFLLPTVSKTALEKKQKETEDLIEEEQKRQDEINKIIKEAADKQLEENQKMRAEESAKIVSDMQEVQNELKKIIENPDFDTARYRELGKDAGKEFNDGFNETVTVTKDDPKPPAKDDSNPSTAPGKYGQKSKTGDTSVEELFSVIKDGNKDARMTQEAGEGSHNGEYGWQNAIDVAGIETAESVAAGKVVFAGWKAGNSYGRHVVIHDDQNAYIYAHLASINKDIKVGDTIEKGTALGAVGGSSAASGKLVDNAYGKHLHLQKAPLKYYKDPLETRANGGTTTQDEVLVGEEGKELAVLPNGRKVMLGANGAELVNLPIGTHIYNNDDTNEIIKYTGSDVEHNTITKYAKGTTNIPSIDINDLENPEKKKKLTEKEKAAAKKKKEDSEKANKKILDELNKEVETPKTMYSKKFGEDFLSFQKGRQKDVDEIAKLDELISKGKNVEKNTAKRDVLQNKLDNDDALSMSKMMKETAEGDFDYYSGIYKKTSKEYTKYINDVNSGKVNFDEKVNTAFIETLSSTSEKLSEVNDQFLKSEQIIQDIANNAMSELDRYVEQETRTRQELIDVYDIIINRQELLLDSTKSQYDYTRRLKEESIEYKKQLRITEALSGMMTAEEISFHFNSGDFETFNTKITEIQGNIDSLATTYEKDISALSDDEMYKAEKITAEYNARLEAEMKKLDVAKAEYSVSKAKKELENVEKQKNTLMFTGDKWEYVADYQKIADATENVVQAEEDLGLTKFDEENQKKIDAQSSSINSTKEKKAAVENEIRMINQAATDLKREYDNYLTPVKDLKTIFSDLATVTFPGFKTALANLSQSIGGGGGVSGLPGGDSQKPSLGTQVTVKTSATGYEWDEASQSMIKNKSKSPHAGKKFMIDKVSSGGGYVKDKNWGWFKLDEIEGYAKGTQNAKAGLIQFDEEGNGSEALFKQTGSGNYTMMTQIGSVFSKANVDTLWDIVKNPENNILSKLLAKQSQPKIDIPNIQPTPPQVNHTFNFGDLSFPEVKGVDEAELFTNHFSGLVNKAMQKAFSSK